MRDYTRSGIAILNDVTKELSNLNELGIYLAKQTDVDALKSLKLLVLASESHKLKKTFGINSVKTYTEEFRGDEFKRNESIIGNLSTNPQNFGLELMEFIVRNYKVDLNVEPYDSKFTIFDFWIRSFERIEFDQDDFYRRYDMINKKIDIIFLLLKNNMLDIYQVNKIYNTFDYCIKNRFAYSDEQLSRMKAFMILFDSLKNINLFNKDDDKFIKLLGNACFTDSQVKFGRTETFFFELNNYEMQNDQCIYMLNTIPELIKKKIIN